MLTQDEPIASPDEDILGRKEFAENLADAIFDYQNIDSLIIGLHGKWGSGKTSIVNLIKYYLYNKQYDFLILDYNPWHFSEQQQLTKHFFEQLAKLIQNSGISKAKQIARQILDYSEYIEPAIEQTEYGTIVIKLIKLIRKFLNPTYDVQESIISQKDKINEELRKLNKRLLVIFDDVDRLTNKEIRQIFQLIKTQADFSNITFLVSFDKNVVLKALKKVQEGDPSEYLNKIVQIQFDVPEVYSDTLYEILTDRLHANLSTAEYDPTDTLDWQNLYHSGFKYYFKNIRDINKYLNLIRFNYSLVAGEVYIPDFAAISSIQTFDPKLFEKIRSNKDLFVGNWDRISYSAGVPQNDDNLSVYKEFFKGNKKLKESCLQDFMCFLFPKVKSAYDKIGMSSDFYEEWDNELRICHPKHFDTYFQLSIPQNIISKSDIRNVADSTDNVDKLHSTIQQLVDSGKLEPLLMTFSNQIIPLINPPNLPIVFKYFISYSDNIFVHFEDFQQSDCVSSLYRILRKILTFYSESDRYEIINSAFSENKKSLYIQSYIVSGLADQHIEFNPKTKKKETDCILSIGNTKKLIVLFVQNVKDAADSMELLNSRRLPFILFRWAEFGSKRDIDSFISSAIVNDSNLVLLVSQFSSQYTVSSPGFFASTINWHSHVSELKKFIDIDQAYKRIKQLQKSGLFEKENTDSGKRIEAFIQAIEEPEKSEF